MILEQWKSMCLGEYFKIKHGWAFKGKFFAEEGKYILLTPGNFNPEGGIKLKGDKEKYYAGDFPKEFLLASGDFLVVMTDLTQNAPILGSAAFVKENDRFLHNQRLGKIVDLDETKINRLFLYYLFNSSSVRNQIKATATGATVKHTAPDRIYSVTVNLPPLPTQHKIAAVLSTYDDLIENNTRRIEILEEMAHVIYREWFIEFRFPGHEGVEMIESELGLIPQGWEVKKVKEIVKRLKAGQTYKEAEVKDTGKIIVVDQSRADFLGFHENEPDHDASPIDPIIIFGDHTCKMQLMITPFSLGPNVVPFIAKDEMPINYLFFGVSNLVETREYKRHWTELNNKEIPVGDLETIERFADFTTPIFEQIETLRQKNQNLRQTRDLLLPKLISGEIDLSELDIDI